MPEQHILDASAQLAENFATSRVPIYGGQLRLPNRAAVIDIISDLRKLLFPAYFGDIDMMTLSAQEYCRLYLSRIENALEEQICLALPEEEAARSKQVAKEVITQLPKIQLLLMKDVEAIYDGDPAAQNKVEIIAAYPGIYAIFVYRIAHELYLRKIPTIPRIMSEHAHSRTGIDIHPGANIGEYFFIDHGTGIVVGETTDIGDHVKLYQGVTLGALSTRGGHDALQGKRHPTVESGAVIYSNASVLGGKTVIGKNTVVGGNSFLTSSVSEDSRVSANTPEPTVRKVE